MSRTLLMPAARVRRTLQRIASEVIERNQGAEGLLVFGIRRRGLGLAERLSEALGEVAGRPFEAHGLDVTPFRDDRPDDTCAAVAPGEAADVEGTDVLLVDDVLFTGRTARAAIDAILALGRPRSIQLAVLVDRGHREFPIQPDYVGRMIPTKYRERIVVEVGEAPAVYLEE